MGGCKSVSEALRNLVRQHLSSTLGQLLSPITLHLEGEIWTASWIPAISRLIKWAQDWLLWWHCSNFIEASRDIKKRSLCIPALQSCLQRDVPNDDTTEYTGIKLYFTCRMSGPFHYTVSGWAHSGTAVLSVLVYWEREHLKKLKTFSCGFCAVKRLLLIEQICYLGIDAICDCDHETKARSSFVMQLEILVIFFCCL